MWAASPPSWLNVKEPAANDTSFPLGPGETAAILLAEELKADWLLIDERDGRELARQRGLSVVGTLAVLSEAADVDLIPLPEVLDRLQATSFHVSQKLIQAVLQQDQARRRARQHGSDPAAP